MIVHSLAKVGHEYKRALDPTYARSNRLEAPLLTPTILDGRIFNPRTNLVYDLLAHVQPGLLLDVGAAAGGFTTRMHQRSPDSKVYGFEPFPGNWPLLEAAVDGIAAIKIDKRAASDTDGSSRLYVSSVVSGTEKGWAGKEGYSSAGTLVDESDSRYQAGFDVETVRIDTLFDEHVRFLKIDVQGAEMAVLRGAHGLIERAMIDFIWVEFTGELEILDYVFAMDYVVFDSPYLVIPRTDPPSSTEWDITEVKNLSSGREAFVAWPHEYPRSPSAYCEWFQEQKSRFVIQNDLTVVHRGFLADYLSAAAQVIR